MNNKLNEIFVKIQDLVEAESKMEFEEFLQQYNNVIEELYNKCVSLENEIYTDKREQYSFKNIYSLVLYYYAQLLSYPQIMGSKDKSIFNNTCRDIFSEEGYLQICSLFEKCIDYAKAVVDSDDEYFKNSTIDKNKVEDAKFENYSFYIRANFFYARFLIFMGETEKSIKFFQISAYHKYHYAYYYLINIHTEEENLNKDLALSYCKMLFDLDIEDPASLVITGAPIEHSQVASFHTIMDYLINNGDYEIAEDLNAYFDENLISAYTLKLVQLNFLGNYNTFVENVEKAVKEYNNKLIEIKKANKIEDELLKDDFDSNVINKMSDDIKIFIVTAIKTFDFLKRETTGTNNLDFSPAIIPMMKSLEILLKQIFVDNYFKYLKQNENLLNLRKINKILKNEEGTSLKNSLDDFTCGNALYMAMYRDYSAIERVQKDYNGKEIKFAYRPNEYFCKFCKSKGISDSENFVQKFGDSLQEIVCIRNNTAHRNRILRQDADEAFNILLKVKKFIGNLYKDFSFCFEN